MQRLNTEEIEALVAQAGADPLAVAVHGLNISLAHHAAWSEERFEKVSDRIDAVETKLDQRISNMEVVLSRIDTRTADSKVSIDGLGFSVRHRHQRLDDIESAQRGVLGRLEKIENGQTPWQVKVDETLDYLKAAGHDHKTAIVELQDGQAALHVKVDSGFAKLEAGQAKLEAGQAKLEAGQAKLEAGQDMLVGEMQKLAAHVTSVLNLAVKGELKSTE